MIGLGVEIKDLLIVGKVVVWWIGTIVDSWAGVTVLSGIECYTGDAASLL